MALLSRGINWRKLFDAGDQVRIASALAQLSADLEDLDARMEGGTNDLNQAQQFPAQDLLERGTQFLTPDLVTSTDGSVTVTPDSFRGTVDLAVPQSSTISSFYGAADNLMAAGGGGPTYTTLTYNGTTSGVGLDGASGVFTAPSTGTMWISFTASIIFTVTAATDRFVTLELFVNGSNYGSQGASQFQDGDLATRMTLGKSLILGVTAGDTIDLRGYYISTLSAITSNFVNFQGFYLST